MHKLEELHQKAVEASKKYKSSEADLLRILEEVREKEVYFHKGYRSLYEYATRCLGLSEGISYALQVVLRKADTVPELKTKIESGELTLQSARRVAAVITPENKTEWLEKAKVLPQRELEKAVAVANPQAAVPTRERSVAKNVNELRVCLSDRGLAALKQVQNILSRRERRVVGLGEVIERLAEFYVEKNDPVVKAERVLTRGKVGCGSRPRHEPEGRPSNNNKYIDGIQGAGSGVELLNGASKPTDGGGDLPDGGLRETTSGSRETTSETKSAREIKSARETNNQQKNNAELFRTNKQCVKTYRTPIPTNLKHQVYRRDRGQCRFHFSTGERCSSKMFLDIHHIRPLSQGGGNELKNLVTLCQAHHRHVHRH